MNIDVLEESKGFVESDSGDTVMVIKVEGLAKHSAT